MTNILFTAPTEDLGNYYLAKSYLEYIQWQLLDIETFITYASKAEMTTRYGQMIDRLDTLKELIPHAYSFKDSNLGVYRSVLKVINAHTINYHKNITDQSHDCLMSESDDEISKGDLDFMKSSIKKWQGYKRYLPLDHYENKLLDSAILSTKAFLKGFFDDSNCFNDGQEYSMQAMDEIEDLYQSIATNKNFEDEYSSLNILNQVSVADREEFEIFLSLHLEMIACIYRENNMQYKIFNSFCVDIDKLSKAEVDVMINYTESVALDLAQASASTVESSLILIRKIFDLAGYKLPEIEMFFPPLESDEISLSAEHDYLHNLLLNS